MHESVLLAESISALNIQPDGIYIDGTFGRGGHSRQILQQLGEQGRLIAIDKDETAIAVASEWQADSRFRIAQDSFANIEVIATQCDVLGNVDGVLLDLGVSSPQLDEAGRGFSFMRDGPLDMRMDQTQGQTAAEWIAKVGEKELADILFQYGEERFSRRIAKAIVEARKQTPLTRTLQLAEVIKKAHPRWEKHKHPATRSFQAIRIWINQELADLQQGLDGIMKVLKPGGRMSIISFHSLEDRAVKQFIQQQERGTIVPRGVAVKEDQLEKRLKRVGKAIKPTQTEIEQNIRSRSAVLRVAEKR